jgi:hypothetical protein
LENIKAATDWGCGCSHSFHLTTLQQAMKKIQRTHNTKGKGDLTQWNSCDTHLRVKTMYIHKCKKKIWMLCYCLFFCSSASYLLVIKNLSFEEFVTSMVYSSYDDLFHWFVLFLSTPPLLLAKSASNFFLTFILAITSIYELILASSRLGQKLFRSPSYHRYGRQFQ